MMSDVIINGVQARMEPAFSEKSVGESGAGFDQMLQEALGRISQVQSDAERAVQELASGDPTEAIVAMEKADMNFQLMVEVRNKLISAYQTVMNMQV
jgi:flagellar hook-basal body complex protein FliE